MSDKVTVKALDTFHISNVSSDNLVEGDVFLVSEQDAARLEKQGLAERGGTTSKAINAEGGNPDLRPDTREEIDAERGFEAGKGLIGAPANKMADAPANKATSTAPARTARKGK